MKYVRTYADSTGEFHMSEVMVSTSVCLRFHDRGPWSPHVSCPACIIDMAGYDFRDWQRVWSGRRLPKYPGISCAKPRN